GEGRLLQQKRGDAIEADDGEVFRGVKAALGAGGLRKRYEAEPVEDPASDREQTAIGEVIDVLAERFGGVERVLGERVRAGGRRGPCINERRLNHVVASRAAAHEAPAIVDVN